MASVDAGPFRAARTDVSPALPDAICFRVTRYCNARCGFCLAPPDGAHPPGTVLADRIDWLLSRGVRTIHFCGGEPTIHPALPELLAHVRARGGRTKLTTNGIAIDDRLIGALETGRSEVKVSLHGDRAKHDRLVGRVAFDRTVSNLRRLLASRVPTSIQTTIVASGVSTIDWMADFCIELGVRRLSRLPFIPRGDGRERRHEFELSRQERRDAREAVSRLRRDLGPRLDVRWLDFNARPVHVVEADGRLVIEHAAEANDELVCRIPERPSV
jgi:MoaA/NifB/PqqE/SkfB family radical SAM enzyme